MTALLAIAGGSVDPRPLFCCCCAEPTLLAAVLSAGYGLARNSVSPTVLAILAVGCVGALLLVAHNTPDPSPMSGVGEEETFDSDVVADNQTFRASIGQTFWWWVVTAVMVSVLAAGLAVRRIRKRSRRHKPAGPDVPTLG